MASAALLMAPEELAARLAEPARDDLVIIEVVSPDEERESPARIPRSVRVWRPDYQLPMSATQPLDGLAPTAEAFEALAQRLGINDDSEVVILCRKYDSARLWWLFVAFGKRSVWLLDGGYKAWTAAGLPTTVQPPPARPRGTWKAQPLDRRMLATRADVRRLRGTARLWDVRTAGEYSGQVTLKGAMRPGRIPWEDGRLEWNAFRDDDGGRWHCADEIRQRAQKLLCGAAPDDWMQHVFYCQSGVRTTQLIFGLCLAGWPLERLKNYDGSWVEWSAAADDPPKSRWIGSEWQWETTSEMSHHVDGYVFDEGRGFAGARISDVAL